MLFWKILLTEFIAEMGDKTQLMLMAMTSRFKLRDIILGTAAAVLVLNGLAVLAGGLVSELVPEWIIKLVAALAFLYFSWSSLKGDDEEEEEAVSSKKGRFAALSVFGTFFVAELGDKTLVAGIDEAFAQKALAAIRALCEGLGLISAGLYNEMRLPSGNQWILYIGPVSSGDAWYIMRKCMELQLIEPGLYKAEYVEG